MSRALMGSVVLLNISLLIVSAALLARQARRRAELTEQLATENEELERRVRRRTAELSALSSHLQQLSEKEKASLARELHDELGGLLIAVKMDVSWLQKRWPNANDPDIQARWVRVLKVLDDGVDFKRRIVESLRPTLLDNMGLLPAVRWITQETCSRAGLHCTEIYPEHGARAGDDAAIMVFRLVQEALTNIVKHAHATRGAGRNRDDGQRADGADRGQRRRHRQRSARSGRLARARDHASSRAQLRRHVRYRVRCRRAARRLRARAAAGTGYPRSTPHRCGCVAAAASACQRVTCQFAVSSSSVEAVRRRAQVGSAPICCSRVGRRSKSRSLSRKCRAPSAAAARRYSARS